MHLAWPETRPENCGCPSQGAGRWADLFRRAFFFGHIRNRAVVPHPRATYKVPSDPTRPRVDTGAQGRRGLTPEAAFCAPPRLRGGGASPFLGEGHLRQRPLLHQTGEVGMCPSLGRRLASRGPRWGGRLGLPLPMEGSIVGGFGSRRGNHGLLPSWGVLGVARPVCEALRTIVLPRSASNTAAFEP